MSKRLGSTKIFLGKHNLSNEWLVPVAPGITTDWHNKYQSHRIIEASNLAVSKFHEILQ